MFWGRKETEYICVIVDNGTLCLTLDQIATVCNCLLTKTQRHIKSFVQFCYDYGDCIHHYSDGAATLTDLCLTNDLGNVVHIKVTKVALEFHKARMISALVLLILTSDHKAEYVVAIDANEVIAIGLLL